MHKSEIAQQKKLRDQAVRKEYYSQNKERILEQQRLYREKHRLSVLAARKVYYRKNKGQMLEANKQYKKKHRARLSARAALWEATVREKRAGRPRPERCEVCDGLPGLWAGKPTRLQYDHCHVTGEFRGWLCRSCNCALGHAQDSIPRLKSLIQYLERNT